MIGSEHYLRLGAAIAAAALLGAAIAWPRAGPHYGAKAAGAVASLKPPLAPMSERGCAPGEAALSGPFAPIGEVLSISPLGVVTAPGEKLPAPFIRINTRTEGSAFERRMTEALAPAKADITAIERRIWRDATGAPAREAWTLHFQICEGVRLVYDDLDRIAPEIVDRAGGLKSFAEIGGPDHLAAQTLIRVKEGESVGRADGFDVALADYAAPPATLERPERYRPDPYVHATATYAPPALIKAIATDVSYAKCPLDYLPSEIAGDWKEMLGDAWGVRRAKGANACRTALVDVVGTAQGAWFTDASHNALASRVSAVALAPDAVDPARLVFALHGRLKSLTPDMVALAPGLEEARNEAARDFLTFEAGAGRINTAFNETAAGAIYCYEGLRANFVGPRVLGVLLMELSADKGAPLMKLEARSEAQACADLPEPWAFTGAETTFYR